MGSGRNKWWIKHSFVFKKFTTTHKPISPSPHFIRVLIITITPHQPQLLHSLCEGSQASETYQMSLGKLASFVATDTYSGTHITYGNSLQKFDKRLNMVFLFQNTQICLRRNAKWQMQLIQTVVCVQREVPRVVILKLAPPKPRSHSTSKPHMLGSLGLSTPVARI